MAVATFGGGSPGGQEEHRISRRDVPRNFRASNPYDCETLTGCGLRPVDTIVSVMLVIERAVDFERLRGMRCGTCSYEWRANAEWLDRF